MAFYDEISKMKTIIRQGWLIEGISSSGRVESDADHTFSTMLLALQIMNQEKLKLNHEKVLKMIAYHDLCEIDCGDHVPFEGIPQEEKYKNELACIKRLSSTYNMPEILELWEEFAQNKTPEAKFVKKLDRLDFLLQCKVYSRECSKPQSLENSEANYPDLVKEFKKYIDEN